MSDFFGTGLNQSPRNFELGEAAYWDLDQLKQIILVDTNVDLSDIRQSIESTNQNVTNLDNATLKKNANLSDLTNKATARNNLGLGNISTLNYNTSYFDVSSGSLVLNQSVRNSLGLADTSVQKNQISQGTGPSQTHVMSQKAVTDALATKPNLNQPGSMGLGVGQSWQDMTLNRAVDTAYTNTSGRPIVVSVASGNVRDAYVSIHIDGKLIFHQSDTYYETLPQSSATAIIPPNSTYMVRSNLIFVWMELR